MAYIQWPATLPSSVSWQGYKRTIQDVRVRTQMDVGPPKVRARQTARVDTQEFSMPFFTKAQWVLLDDFYTNTLFNGVLPFELTDPFTATTTRYRFVEPPVMASMLGPDTIHVTMKFEVMPQ